MTEFILLACLALAVVASCLGPRTRRRFHRPIRLGNGSGWGSVYVLRDKRCPGLVKVGTTRRLITLRKREIGRTMTDNADLVQVAAFDLPFARAVETLAHRRLTRQRVRRGTHRGREWFHARTADELGHVLMQITQAAEDVRRAALRRERWPTHGDRMSRRWTLSTRGPVRTALFR